MANDNISRLLDLDPATIGHFLNGGYMLPYIKPLNDTVKVAGPAYTVRVIGKDSASLYHALQHAKEGSVIVIDKGGDNVYAPVGEVVSLVARQRNIAGIVIDGPATDSVAIRRSGYPVFCSGVSVATTNVLGITGDWEQPISCGGTAVHPGDIIFGDADGVVVIPPERLDDVLVKAEEALERERRNRNAIAEGKPLPIDADALFDADVAGLIKNLRQRH